MVHKHQNKNRTLQHATTMLIRTIRIHTVCTDKATELQGTITHWKINGSNQVNYLFQAEGLNPENGHPLDAIYLDEARLILPEGDHYEETNVPMEILGTEVTHTASGFKGSATSFVMHPHGCFHVHIQPKGRLKKTNGPTEQCHFALIACSGEKIPKLTPEEKKVQTRDHPSPSDIPVEKF
jgi:hypothetical protein